MVYTNGSPITKTFHGVTFQPGETKAVAGIINDPTFYRSSKRQEPPKRARRESSAKESNSGKKESKSESKIKRDLNIESMNDVQVKVELNQDSEVDTSEIEIKEV